MSNEHKEMSGVKKRWMLAVCLLAACLLCSCGQSSDIDRLRGEVDSLRSELSRTMTADTSANGTAKTTTTGSVTTTTKGETADYVRCPECLGTGYFNACGACDGTGLITVNGERVPCTNCDGCGKNQCFQCGGEGKILKSVFDASSLHTYGTYTTGATQATPAVPNTPNHPSPVITYTRAPVTPMLPGRGTPCRMCDGTGKQTCSYCHGEKYKVERKRAPYYGGDYTPSYYTVKIPCSICHATGKVKCLYCGGSKTLP